MVPCRDCQGIGRKDDRPCPSCGGTGRVARIVGQTPARGVALGGGRRYTEKYFARG